MNWKTILNDLFAVPLTIEQVAAEMGVTPNALREILAGRTVSPRFEAATKLLALHKKAITRSVRRRIDRAQATEARA